jgi:glycosyltransferase involved in cell wall biosynthesis
VHFVGTGWDFAGFGFHHLARRLGARFTVWPAVHPGAWGDDSIDLRLYCLADVVFCQSHGEAEHLKKRGLDSSKIVISGLPPMCLPDRDGLAFRKIHGLGSRPVVLFLGRRDKGKGYPALLAAWRQVLNRHPDAVLVLSGPGGDEYAALSECLPAGSLLDLGVASEEEKANALAACDVFCLPSSQESFGIVFVEAWSYGKPVICGTAPASREWVDASSAGLPSDQDPENLSTTIGKLLADPALRASMGSEGKKFQSEYLTWDLVARNHLQAFQFSG